MFAFFLFQRRYSAFVNTDEGTGIVPKFSDEQSYCWVHTYVL
jgi:hypothetical protein